MIELGDQLTRKWDKTLTVVALTDNAARVWAVVTSTLETEHGLVNGNARLIDVGEYAILKP